MLANGRRFKPLENSKEVLENPNLSFQVLLVQYRQPFFHDVTCSGSLIKENAVLTAAHCCMAIQNLVEKSV